jgi:glycine cleavage system transcriptional repressor
MEKKVYIISVLIQDRIGIIRDVTGCVTELGGNLTDLNQIVMGGVFSLNCLAEFEGEIEVSVIQEKLNQFFSDTPDAVRIAPASAKAVPSAHKVDNSKYYVAAISGPDQPGRIHLITKLFASHGVNVEDWRHDLSDRNNALTIGLITIPHDCKITQLQAELREIMSPYGVSCSIRHENIFRATNEVGPISALLTR